MGRITETIKVLIVINAIFFIGTQFLGESAYRLFSLYYFESPNFQYWQPITHMFMHGGFMHILFNMYALWAFGSPLELQWGRNKFLFFYFSAGLGAALIHTLVNYFHFHSGFEALVQAGMSEGQIIQILTSGQYNTAILNSVPQETIQSLYDAYNTPAVGASGAVYGVLVAFGLMYPNAELMLIFLPIPIKAKYFIPALLLLDLFSGVTGFSLFGQNIANWAHIGGALFGFIMAYYWKKNSFDKHRWN
ncbi:membrane associated rhomboid family serine protease [Ulvibacter sp. MAR_2010_11]|uniref:rhomboid family intramembrane serine protease n=1 Tax=Ulvibacter sp. MAR_2010_11 TaxID=1250229 RepID=UPI000C2C212B|nr:rhomboid family intramembrane serine protease [Ulvibacter sp. MAR_2010_11]PKA83798.1 membrane associated rhomboid family serine protease [Ulvibacter sp. MAR_2010_11]